VGENSFLYRGIKYNIFGLIPKTSYVTQTLNIKYRGTIEPRATLLTFERRLDRYWENQDQFYNYRAVITTGQDSLDSDSEETELVQEADDCLLPEEDL
jgi:hypothetical protein